MRGEMFAIQIGVCHRHHALEVQRYQLVFPRILRPEVFPIPRHKVEHVGDQTSRPE